MVSEGRDVLDDETALEEEEMALGVAVALVFLAALNVLPWGTGSPGRWMYFMLTIVSVR